MPADKGKKRARSEVDETFSVRSESPLTDLPDDFEVDIGEPEPGPARKYRRRGETRVCPVCNERIPTRLLAAHADLEAERVEAIIRRVGETEVDVELLDAFERLVDDPTAITLTRSGGVRTRYAVVSSTEAPTDLVLQASQKIQAIRRNRKQRNIKLRELVRGDLDLPSTSNAASSSRLRETWRRRNSDRCENEITCPICLVSVRGDPDVLDAHVDACLADQSRRLEEERREQMGERRRGRPPRDREMQVDDGPGHVGDVTGTGIAARDPTHQDIDDEIDIDGDDEAVFGGAQFTEDDVVNAATAFPPTERLRPNDDGEDMDVDIDGDGETLRELVARGKDRRERRVPQIVEQDEQEQTQSQSLDDMDKLELAILAAGSRGEPGQASLVGLLQSKIKILESRTLSLCRICIEPYTEPTVSTGCWHTCCRECWLRCLGTNKLCPMCKRITGAAELRRVFL
ncbi:RING-type domain-containing protein [Mycena chlorophos]|uniref:RING-type domain-containing protein n=1 Tax=Mycena chlorophos TaxID=658473 RepID=A0A8H6VWN2_MYCCL|nr:RING-type domain-containing protein [Mycena chlorophos]